MSWELVDYKATLIDKDGRIMQFENAVIAGYPIVLPDFRAEFHRQRPNWHKAWLDSIHKHLKPDDLVIDVGAEQGDLSALVASWVPDGGIVLMEPVAGFWPTIRETFEANGLRAIECVPAFASDATTYPWASTVGLWPDESLLDFLPEPGFQHLNERQDMVQVNIDAMLFVPSPTAMLIDAEGAELRVLKGAEQTLTNNRPQVWCAIHPEIMADRYGDDPNDLLEYMRELGYDWELLGFQGEIHVRFHPR